MNPGQEVPDDAEPYPPVNVDDVEMTSSSLQSEEDEEPPPIAVPLSLPHPEAEAAQQPTDIDDPVTTTVDRAPPPTTQLQPQEPVPVLLLTGYLGAGKTTLVNYILSENHGYRCAVLLNEIANSADIEQALVRDPEGSGHPTPLADWRQLENGCICCSAKNDMVQALESLMVQRDRFDYIIIETTGLANPGPVAAALWTDAELESSICLDAIVTVVDAKNIVRHIIEDTNGVDGYGDDKGMNEKKKNALSRANEAQQQIAFADIILLNKCDLVEESVLDGIEQEIRRINAEVDILRCQRCVIDVGEILHTGLYSSSSSSVVRQRDRGDGDACTIRNTEKLVKIDDNDDVGDGHTPPPPTKDGHVCDAPHCNHHSHHRPSHHDVKTVTLYASAPLNMTSVRHWLDEVLWNERDGGRRDDTVQQIFRVKGLLRVAGSETKWVVQAVHETYDIVETSLLWDTDHGTGGSGRSKVVFIGRGLDAEELQRGLSLCSM